MQQLLKPQIIQHQNVPMCKWTFSKKLTAPKRGKENLYMSNYHLEIQNVSRGKGRSFPKAVNYISGERIHDNYNDTTYYCQRQDVLYHEIFQPDTAPPEFHNLQNLCDEIDKTEKRYDARTAREFIGSLPNELPTNELIQIVKEYVSNNFVEHGLCAVAAIHEGRNKTDPSKNNPHVHILVSTRTVGPEGFSKKKDREHNNKKYIDIWREDWAKTQNRAYERNGYDIRVSHESLEVQGKYDREPTIHMSRIDWQKEKNGERTISGDRKRAIRKRNEDRIREQQLKQDRSLDFYRSR